jgi:hypothetical protein
MKYLFVLQYKDLLLKYLYISGKKSPNELAEYFKTIIPNCTPQFIMAIIKPFPHINHIIDSVVKTEEKCVAYFQIKDLDFMKENPRWYEKEIKYYENHLYQIHSKHLTQIV